VRIGYSFWGFLGPGITDTPDGGRSHRRVLLDGLRARGHDIVVLQTDRDHAATGLDITTLAPDLPGRYRRDPGLPDLDVLFLEWRWPIPDRNTTPCGRPGHTCDLHRQHDLLDHYTHRHQVRTIIWDKDRQLAPHDPLRRAEAVTVCEAALSPTPGATSLLFPVADTVLDTADPIALAARPRPTPLVYVGNQYDRDTAFATYFAPAATQHRHVVAGKWTRTDAWPHISFVGRVPFAEVAALHGRALATVLLLPDRYTAVGQMTQRLPEAVLAGCLPLTPTTIHGAERFSPPRLHVTSGNDVADAVRRLARIVGTAEHADLIAACLARLDLFRLSRQLENLDPLLTAAPRRVGS
jgi:hypothetical protein